MGFDQLYAATIAPGQAAGDLERRAFAEIIDIRLEGQAQAGNLSARHAVDHPRRIFKNMIDLCVIHFTSGTDETRVLRVAMNDEPRVHSDAMPSNAWAGLQDIHPGMPIGESDHFPHIQIKAIGDHRSAEHTSELKSIMRTSSAVFCLKK